MLESEVGELCSKLQQDLQSNTVSVKVANRQIVQKGDVSVMGGTERGGRGRRDREREGIGEYRGRVPFSSQLINFKNRIVN